MKRRTPKKGPVPALLPRFRPTFLSPPWLLLWSGALAAIAILYGPALRGPFVFDDFALPFQLTVGQYPLSFWLKSMRPVLMFTYWMNQQLGAGGTFGYHLVNLAIHATNSVLVFQILRRLLTLARWPEGRAAAGAWTGAAVFLVHPLATESVSYIAGRSESLAAMFALGSYAWFLHRRETAIRWVDALAILALFGLGAGSKENAVALAGIFILTDWFFPRSSARKLYALLAPAALFAVVVVLQALVHGGNAGFSIREFTWYQYAFTQSRAILTYIRMALLPFGQSVDHDFPISRSILDHQAWLCLTILAAAIVCALRMRRRYPLAAFGLIMFLIWLAPTSSVIPIADPLVERRTYLPLIGLILMAAEAASRIRVRPTAIAAILLVLAVLTWNRNLLWGHPDLLFVDAIEKSVNNPRPVANLTETLIAANRCREALPWLERAARKLPDNYVIEASTGRALECVGDKEKALTHLQKAVDLHPGWKLYELIGLLYGEMDRLDESGDALRKAIAMEPNAGSPHRSLALWHAARHDAAAAAAEYREALRIDPMDTQARIGLARILAAASAPVSRNRGFNSGP